MAYNEKTQELRKALMDFGNAYYTLMEKWEQAQDLYRYEFLLTYKYPFEQSFDEYEIAEWVANGLQQLRK